MKLEVGVAKICKAYTKERRTCGITPLEKETAYCRGVDCIYGHDIVKINKWLELRMSQDTKYRWQARELFFEMVIDAIKRDKCVPFPPYTPKPTENRLRTPLANVPTEYFESEMKIYKLLSEADVFWGNRQFLLYMFTYLRQFPKKR